MFTVYDVVDAPKPPKRDDPDQGLYSFSGHVFIKHLRDNDTYGKDTSL